MLPGGITWSVMITFVTPILQIITMETVLETVPQLNKASSFLPSSRFVRETGQGRADHLFMLAHSLSINLIRLAAGADLSHI